VVNSEETADVAREAAPWQSVAVEEEEEEEVRLSLARTRVVMDVESTASCWSKEQARHDPAWLALRAKTLSK
jgi:hypothetical protein